MLILRKIFSALFIISTLIIGNISAAVLDLPDNTPGLQQQEQNKSINGIAAPCKHIIVPGTKADERLFESALGVDPIELEKDEGNIYFPCNGVQPTTEEAAEYSCANVDNTLDSPITNWYMQMFGIQKYQNEFLSLGLNLNNNPYRILDISDLSTQDPDNELPKKYASQQDAFIQNFKEIASTSVGRTLLYRILIEIRRNDGTIEQKGCVGDDVKSPVSINERNNCRYLKIKWEPRGNSFNLSQKIINFGVQFPVKKSTTLGKKKFKHPIPIIK